MSSIFLVLTFPIWLSQYSKSCFNSNKAHLERVGRTIDVEKFSNGFFYNWVEQDWCRITGTSVRMRKSPSLNGQILGYFTLDEYVLLIKYSNDYKWCYVKRKNGELGWVFSQYMDCPGC